MRRREFLGLIGGAAAAWPLAGRAQQAATAPKVGYLYPGPKTLATARIDSILKGVRESGYAAPAQIEIVLRTTEGDPTRIAPLAAEIVQAKVDVVFAIGREARNIRDRRMRPEIESHAIAGQHAGTAVVQFNLDGFRRNEAARTHDQLGAAGLVAVEVHGRSGRRPSRAFVPALASCRWPWNPSRSQSDRRGERDRQLSRSKSRSCWAGSWCSGRNRRSTCVRRRRCGALIWPCARPEICHPRHYRGRAFHSVRFEASSPPHCSSWLSHRRRRASRSSVSVRRCQASHTERLPALSANSWGDSRQLRRGGPLGAPSTAPWATPAIALCRSWCTCRGAAES